MIFCRFVRNNVGSPLHEILSSEHKNALKQKKKIFSGLITVEVTEEKVRNTFDEFIEAYQKLKLCHDDYLMARDFDNDDMVNVMYTSW